MPFLGEKGRGFLEEVSWIDMDRDETRLRPASMLEFWLGSSPWAYFE